VFLVNVPLAALALAAAFALIEADGPLLRWELLRPITSWISSRRYRVHDIIRVVAA
jgi:hypothetical protein